MANANVIEIEACLVDSLRFCEGHMDLEFVRHYQPRLERANHEFHESIRLSDEKWTQWQREREEDRLVWKHLANEYLGTQRKLRSLNAVGFPDAYLRHWDEQALAGFVADMIAYLEERRKSIPDAGAMSDRLQRLSNKANSENVEGNEAFKQYQRYASQRSTAFGLVGATLSDFRGAMRRHYGKRDATYQSVRWPMNLNSDETVL